MDEATKPLPNGLHSAFASLDEHVVQCARNHDGKNKIDFEKTKRHIKSLIIFTVRNANRDGTMH